jgi:hypothetical protein
MKVRITQAGYQNFTGEMGHIDFVDGVSVSDLNPDFVRSLSGIVQVEEVPPEPTPESGQSTGDKEPA